MTATGELGRLLAEALAALPKGSTLTEQCGVRFAVGGDPTLVGNCGLAERIDQFTPDEHVHRFVLVTPWAPRRRRPSPTTARRPENAPERRCGPPGGP